jgi:putative addiction module component (TIGR02574 family)
MTREAEEILAIAEKLSVEERARLAMRLLDSIAAPDERTEIAEAQRAESRSRLDAARAGELEVVDDEDAMRMIAE